MHRDFQELRACLDGLVPEETRDSWKLSKSCNMYRLALERLYHRLPFVSSMGYIDVVTAQSKKEDLISIVEGANSPFVSEVVVKFMRLLAKHLLMGLWMENSSRLARQMEIFHVC